MKHVLVLQSGKNIELTEEEYQELSNYFVGKYEESDLEPGYPIACPWYPFNSYYWTSDPLDPDNWIREDQTDDFKGKFVCLKITS